MKKNKERIIKILAFLSYAVFLKYFIHIPEKIDFFLDIFINVSIVVNFIILEYKLLKIISKYEYELLKEKINNEIKKVFKELLYFLPIWIIFDFLILSFANGISANEISIRESFFSDPIFYAIISIIIGPICEEMMFRYLPSIFIKNETIYIIITAVLFAAMHVVDDPNPLYWFLFYLPNSIYLGCRYIKTRDIMVSISLHAFNNLMCIIIFYV